jgi:hypothetical protein
MRRAIETVPKDGKLVILEDGARGTYEVARWSAEQSGWVGETGKPIPIAPTHWLPLQRDDLLLPSGNEHLQTEEKSCGSPDRGGHHNLPLSSDRADLEWPSSQELEWPSSQEDVFGPRQVASAVNSSDVEPQTVAGEPEPRAVHRFAFTSIALAMIASSLVGMYFRAPMLSYLKQYADQPAPTVGRVTDRPLKQEVQQADLLGRGRAVQPSDKSDGRDEHEASGTPQTNKSSQATGFVKGAEERNRSAALAGELAMAQQNVETQMTRSNNAASEVAQLKKAANTAASDLQRERERAEALASDLAKGQRAVNGAGTSSRRKDDEAVQIKQVAEMATAKLQQALQQQRERAQTLESEMAKTPQHTKAQVAAPRESIQAAEYANAERSLSQHKEREPIWSRYVSNELRIGVDLPKDVFVVDGGPTKTLDGRSFRTADGRADVSIYSIGKPAGETPKSFLRNRFQLPSSNVFYRHLKGRVLALSGFRDDKIWYARCNFASVRVNCVALNYPAREKRSFDAIVTRISNTLSIPSDG